jgi:hypothetical protein
MCFNEKQKFCQHIRVAAASKVGVGFVEEFDRALMALDLSIASNGGILRPPQR